MRKLLNDPHEYVDDALAGLLAAHPGLRIGSDPRAIVRVDSPAKGRVAIATGGGFGHLPLFVGYVGRGLADGCAVGNVFASPSAEQILSTIQAVDGGRGVLCLYGNYSGDRINFELASGMAREAGIEIQSVRASDDVASAPAAQAARRRGIAGIFFLYKVAGAAAELGATLDEVVGLVERASSELRSMGVALSAATIPAAGRSTFELADGEMEIGMGIHGEPGMRRAPTSTARDVATELVDTIGSDLALTAGDRVAVLVNGLGATPIEELYILFGAVVDRLAALHVEIGPTWVGEFATSMEMAGASVSLLRFDDVLSPLITHAAWSPVLGHV